MGMLPMEEAEPAIAIKYGLENKSKVVTETGIRIYDEKCMFLFDTYTDQVYWISMQQTKFSKNWMPYKQKKDELFMFNF